MNRHLLAASVLSTALGLALAMQTRSGGAAQQKTEPTAQHLEKCYGINAVGKNDCASGAHSCAGLATTARDPQSYVELPTGDCSKISGGSLKPA
jgi:uncharacterized membrane protein